MKAESKEVQMTIEGKHSKSGYQADVHPVLVSYFAQEGLTDAQIAAKLRISRSTLNTWRKGHPELMQALKFGKEQADAQVVMSLFQQALKGNVTAQIFWLLNRIPLKWRNKREVDAHIDAPAKPGMSLEEVVRIFADAGVAGGLVEAQITSHVGKERTDASVAEIFSEAIRDSLELDPDRTP